MLKIANRKNLKAFSKQLLGNEYSPEKEKELINACLEKRHRLYPHHHISHERAAHLEKIDKILGNYGVEGILETSEKGEEIDIQYSNAGDTYNLTILYYKDRLFIGDWGSIVEELS
jgi:hypothetical protein